jgi:hypothetical protein
MFGTTSRAGQYLATLRFMLWGNAFVGAKGFTASSDNSTTNYRINSHLQSSLVVVLSVFPVSTDTRTRFQLSTLFWGTVAHL